MDLVNIKTNRIAKCAFADIGMIRPMQRYALRIRLRDYGSMIRG